ncbi:MAG: YybH family protein [Lysobacter sp.]
MHRTACFALPLVLWMAGDAFAQSTPTAPATLSPDECAVWARELSFAQSVADHDAEAFAEHVHPDAVFNASGPAPTRGREAITRRWKKIIDGELVALSWYPSQVTIGGAGDIAWSSGPSLYEDRKSRAIQYTVGTFYSVWHRGDDGVWRVVFDEGTGQAGGTVVDARDFHAARKTACPKA